MHGGLRLDLTHDRSMSPARTIQKRYRNGLLSKEEEYLVERVMPRTGPFWNWRSRVTGLGRRQLQMTFPE